MLSYRDGFIIVSFAVIVMLLLTALLRPAPSAGLSDHPAAAVSFLQIRLRPRAEMADHLGRGDRRRCVPHTGSGLPVVRPARNPAA